MVVGFKCKFLHYGCLKQGERNEIAQHEEDCQYRDIHCLAKHRAMCLWTGSRAKLYHHVRENACIQVLTDEPFKSFIKDFSQSSRMSVFTRTSTTHWKPILLVNNRVFHYLIYLTVQRSSVGLWYIHIRSFYPQSKLQRIKVRLDVFNPGGVANAIQRRHVYEGAVISNTLSEHEALDSGEFLLMTDSQVKLLRTPDKIFEYTIKVTIGHIPS